MPLMPAFHADPPGRAAAVRDELAAGLLQPAASIAPKYFYDRLGSALFAAITELDEYTPTRAEAEVFAVHGDAIAQALRARLPPGYAMVDLGAADGAKAERLFGRLRPGRYVAVDIAADFLRLALQALQQRHPALPMAGVATDFATRLALPPGLLQGPSLLFYPGSSIGNFETADALRLLREARDLSCGGALLIGVDLWKPTALLHAAYDDALGVTAAFNLNVLRHVNRLLGSDFDPAGWRHAARVDEERQRVQMHLHARADTRVRWPGGERRFRAGEAIHTENSHKWTPAAFEALLHDAGWHGVRCFTAGPAGFGVFTALA